MKNFNLPWFGGGAGLRHEHFAAVIEKRPPFRWFEIISEDFLGIGGSVQESLAEIRKHYRIIPHGVGLSIGSTDPLDLRHVRELKKFLHTLGAPWYSDHLCFTMVDHTNLENLIPVPFTREAVNHIAERIKIIQQELEIPFLFENVTRYITVSDREMPESEFINQILERANCGLLLDVTNVILNSKYHRFDPKEFIQSLPLGRVAQMHLAGWEGEGDDIIDSHDAPVPAEVWDLLKVVLERTGPSSVLVEWDKSLPTVERLLKEAQMADDLVRAYASKNEKEAA